MNAIVPTTPPLAYGDLERLADSIAKSNLFGIKTKEQAIVLMMISHAEGRHPALAARDFDIINGRPAKKAEAMMRDFVQAGGKVEWHALTDELADATFTHPQTGSVRIDWDMKRAMTAFGKKDMYAKFPRQMLRSRVVSEGVRTLWPLATSGFHVPEEMADMKPEHNGTTLEGEAEAPRDRHAEINREVPLRAAAAPMPRGATVSEPPKRTRAQFLDGLQIALNDAVRDENAAEMVDRIICGEEVMRAKAEFRNGHLDRLNWMIANALTAITPPADTTDELPDVEIAGEDKVLAG